MSAISEINSSPQWVCDIETFIAFKITNMLSGDNANAIVEAANNSGQSLILTIHSLIPHLPILAKWNEDTALIEFESWTANRDLDIPFLSSDLAKSPAGLPPSGLAEPALPPVIVPASDHMYPIVLSLLRLIPMWVLPLQL